MFAMTAMTGEISPYRADSRSVGCRRVSELVASRAIWAIEVV
jgi:hypothetical protein